MAAPTLLWSGQLGWNSTHVLGLTTGSISPGANKKLACLVTYTDDENNGGVIDVDSVASSGSGPTWSSVAQTGSQVGYTSRAAIWTASIGGTDPGAFQVIIDFTIGHFIGQYIVTIWSRDAADADPTTPWAGATVQGNQSGNGAETLTLGATPVVGDYVIAQSIADVTATGRGATFGTTRTWVESYDSAASGQHVAGNAGHSTGSTSTTVDWTDVNAGGDETFNSAQAAIISKSSSGPIVIDPAAADHAHTADAAAITGHAQLDPVDTSHDHVADAASVSTLGGKISVMSVVRNSPTQATVSWAHPDDAPLGVTIGRAPGRIVNDGEGREPSNPAYDPTTVTGYTTLDEGLTASPYVDTSVDDGAFTYWIVRTA